MAGTISSSLKFLVVGIVVAVLYMSAQMSREALGAHNLSRTEDLSWRDCLDGGVGSAACVVKQAAKLYVFNRRGEYVHNAQLKARSIAHDKAIKDGLSLTEADERAAKVEREAGKLASRKHKRTTGALIAGVWDFFEVLYYGGTIVEGTLKAAGTVSGTWLGGALVEQKLGRLGYLIGSQVGSWIGGELGLMVYDVCNGMRLMTYALGGFLNGSSEPVVEVETIDSSADYR